MKKFGLVSFALAASVFAAPLTWEQLIKSADDDPRYKAAEKRAEMSRGGQKTKLWDKLELRYKLDGFSFASHDFELRVTPKSFGEGAADREHWDAQAQYQKARLAEDRGVLMYDRYERAIHYLQRQRLNKLTRELYQVNADRIEVLHLKSGSASFNPQDLMAALEKEAALRAELISDSTSLENAEAKLRLWVPDFDGVDLDSTWLPSMADVEKEIQEGFTVDESFPQIAKALGKKNSETSKAKQDVASGRDYISHIGIGYSMKIESLSEKYKDLYVDDVAPGKDYDKYYDEFWTKYPDGDATASIRKIVPDVDNRKTSDKFFLSMGVRLPFFDSNKDSDLRYQVAELDAEGDYMDVVRSVNLKVAKLVDEINTLIAQWKVQKEFVEQVNAGSIFEQFAKNAGSDPLLLLRARESGIESDMRAIKIETEVLNRYLELLQYAGVLSQEGFQNHLQKGLK